MQACVHMSINVHTRMELGAYACTGTETGRAHARVASPIMHPERCTHACGQMISLSGVSGGRLRSLARPWSVSGLGRNTTFTSRRKHSAAQIRKNSRGLWPTPHARTYTCMRTGGGHRGDGWTKGPDGKDCIAVCKARGRTCDAGEMGT